MKIYTPILLTLFLFFNSEAKEAHNTNDKEIVWQDEFNGTQLDTTKWTYQIGNGCPELCGWGNNERQYYTDRNSNLRVGNGYLNIIVQEEFYDIYDYTSARIRSIQNGDWTYGKFEARIKLPKGKGIWPAFWMLPSKQSYGAWPKSGEIDIMELVGHEASIIHGTLHYAEANGKHKYSGEKFELKENDFSNEFHVFAIEWGEDKISWYLDDVLITSQNPESISPGIWPFNRDFHFILNVAVGGNWPCNPDETTVFPQEMIIDYVRVYQ